MLECKLRLRGHKGLPTLIRLSRDGKLLVSTGHDKRVRTWDTTSGKQLQSFAYLDKETFAKTVGEMELSPKGEYLVTGFGDQSTKVFDTSNGKQLSRLSKRDALQMRFSPDGTQLACTVGLNVECFRTRDWSTTAKLAGHTSKVHLLEYSPDGKILISAGGKYVNLWNVKTNKLQTTLEGHKKLLGSMAVAPDSSFLATGGEDNQVILWSLPKGKPLATYSEHSSQVFGLAISPDTDIIASADYKQELRIWRRSTLQTLAVLKDDCWFERLAFSPDGKYLAFSVCGTGVRLLDAKSGNVVAELPESVDLVWSPNGDWLASADEKAKDIVLWNTAKKSRKAKK